MIFPKIRKKILLLIEREIKSNGLSLFLGNRRWRAIPFHHRDMLTYLRITILHQMDTQL